MTETVHQALAMLAAHGGRLREALRFDWPSPVSEAVHRLLLSRTNPAVPPIAAIVGGASSGKSTLFNNLLGGHLVSRVSAKGHSTLGPILGVHHSQFELVNELLTGKKLFPGLNRVDAELDANAIGEPGALTVVAHGVDQLRDLLLLDLPDFTSEAARLEGDAALTLWPWFDRVIVVVDYERWFDRQSATVLRSHCVRFGQPCWVLFNRTQEGVMAEADEKALREQGGRLGADGVSILDFRRGRGLCLFPPGTLDDALRFVTSAKPDRSKALFSVVADSANKALNQNEERTVKLRQLRESVDAAIRRTLPSEQECMTAIMTAQERSQLNVLSRVLRLGPTRQWLAAQTQWLQQTLARIPVLGSAPTRVSGPANNTHGIDRTAAGLVFVENVLARQSQEVRRVVQASAFWDELRRWTGLGPQVQVDPPEGLQRPAAERTIAAFDAAMTRWNTKVERECAGFGPYLKGAVGVGTIGLAVVLIAVPGPLAALTLAAGKGAIAGALSHILLASGAGAALGKQFGRLGAVVQEKLVGSEEFNAVLEAARALRARLQYTGQGLADQAVAEAYRLLLPSNDPLYRVLQSLRGRMDG